MLRVALLVSLAVLQACTNEVVTSPGGCFAGNGGFGGAGGSTTEQLLLTGKSETVALVLEVPGCGDALRSATGVSTVVLGPDNMPVAHTDDGAASQSFEHRTNVTFVPAQPGPYHLTATFQPNLGTAQLDVRVAKDLSTVAATLTAPSGCNQVAVTSKGSLLCIGTMLRVLRGATEVQTLTADAVAVSGDTVWVADAFTATRWLDSGSGPMTMAIPATVTLPAKARALIAGADELWAAFDSEIKHYTLDMGTFVSRERWTFPSNGTPLVMAHDANGLLVASTSFFCSTAGAAAGTLTCSSKPFAVYGTFGNGAGIWGGVDGVAADLWLPGRTSPAASIVSPYFSGWQQRIVQGDGPLPVSQPYTVMISDGAPVLAKWGAQPTESIEGFTVFGNANSARQLRAVP